MKGPKVSPFGSQGMPEALERPKDGGNGVEGNIYQDPQGILERLDNHKGEDKKLIGNEGSDSMVSSPHMTSDGCSFGIMVNLSENPQMQLE